MRPLIVIPVVSKENLDECLKTINKEFHKDVLIVNNNPEINLDNDEYKVFNCLNQYKNIGVARSWNLGARLIKNSSFDFLVILSSSMRFRDGMVGLYNQLKQSKNENGLMTQEGWHCLAIHKRVFKQIGYFDTNFYPGYYEDSDFIRRMEVARIHEPCGDIHLPGITIDAHSAEIAHSIKKVGIKVNMMACRNYFVEKWGADPLYDSKESRDKLYRYPFNNPNFNLKYYPKRTIEELKILYNLV